VRAGSESCWEYCFALRRRSGPEVSWIIVFIMAVYAVFVVCIVIAVRAALRAADPGTRKIAYMVFRDLLALFARRKRG
jgi:hypothetical protein